jgi:surface protein
MGEFMKKKGIVALALAAAVAAAGGYAYAPAAGTWGATQAYAATTATAKYPGGYGTVSESADFSSSSKSASWWFTSDYTFVVGSGEFDWLDLRDVLHSHTRVKKIVFLDGSVGTGSVYFGSSNGVFMELTYLESVSGKVNTSSLVSTSYMFYHCPSLKSVDLSSWNMSNVTDMSNMFGLCTVLPSSTCRSGTCPT